MKTIKNLNEDINTIKFQVVSDITNNCYFTGTNDECQEWIENYGLGNTQFEILPFDGCREYGDLGETY